MDQPQESFDYTVGEQKPKPADTSTSPKNSISRVEGLKHLGLFILTFASVAYTGLLYVSLSPEVASFEENLLRGALFAALLLSFLTVHEFGHYFAAVKHNISVSLPYFIPLPLIAIGTLGAVIRIKERIRHMYMQFDVGAAGPLAGFVVALIVLIVGFATLPEPTYLENFGGHSETLIYIDQYGEYPTEYLDNEDGSILIVFGDTLLYSFIASFFDNVPPMWEMHHFPFLLAGWLGLFFTALNLMPVGQLDGGHILYSLIGYERHKVVARIFYTGLSSLAGLTGVATLHTLLEPIDNEYATVSWLVWASLLFIIMNLAFKKEQEWLAYGWTGSLVGSVILLFTIGADHQYDENYIWLVWMLFITLLVKIEHPPVLYEAPLSPTRKVLGWLSILIFVLCISPNPISIITP